MVMTEEYKLDVDDCITYDLGKDNWRITPDKPYYVTMKNIDVDFIFKIPLSHRLLKLEFNHADQNNDPSTDSLNLYLSKLTIAGIWRKIWRDLAVTVADPYVVFPEQYKFEPMTYQIRGNTTNLHRLYFDLYIELLQIPKPVEGKVPKIKTQDLFKQEQETI